MQLLGCSGCLLCSCFGVLSGLACCRSVAMVFLIIAMWLLWCDKASCHTVVQLLCGYNGVLSGIACYSAVFRVF